MPKNSPKSVSPNTTKLATGKTRDPRKPEKKATAPASKSKTAAVPELKKPIAKANGTNGHTKPEPAVDAAPGAKGSKAKPAAAVPAVISVIDQPDVQEKLRELIRLAKEQGYLTFDDLNEALPDNVNDPDEMETIMTRLRA